MRTDILDTIRNRMPSFSKSQKVIGNYILDHYDTVAYMTASRLGYSVNVSESTVVRFATVLGFDGYPALSEALKDIVRTSLTSNQRIEITTQRLGNSDVLTNVLNADIDRIRTSLENIDRNMFINAVNALIEANGIYICGARTSATLAQFLSFNLNLMFDNVHQIQSAGGSELFEQLLRLKEGDIVFAISFPRYSKRIVNTLQYAKREGAKVIVLTDSLKSPAAKYSDFVLTAQSDMESFVDSLVAPLSIINALIVAISVAKKGELTGTFEKLEKIWKENDFYEMN